VYIPVYTTIHHLHRVAPLTDNSKKYRARTGREARERGERRFVTTREG
jgi:hypothetical protein